VFGSHDGNVGSEESERKLEKQSVKL